jgi:hypothetical protein
MLRTNDPLPLVHEHRAVAQARAETHGAGLLR